MKSLTLNNTITQLRYKKLGHSYFQYEAMINSQWQPVTHKVVKYLWESFKGMRS